MMMNGAMLELKSSPFNYAQMDDFAKALLS